MTGTAALRLEAIGVPWEIVTPAALAADAVAAVRARIDDYDLAWSRFRPDSTVARIAREPGSWRLGPEAGPLLDLYRRLYAATDGRLSPLVGGSLERLGYDAALRLAPSGPALPAPAWEDAIAWDGERLAAPRPVSIDVGAAGKGQLVDLVAEVLAEHGEPEHLVDASGDLLRRGPGTIRVALEHPGDPSLAVGVVELGDGALCASAVNRRSWPDGRGGRLHHVLDATTGLPAGRVIASWALAPTAMVADGAATALLLAEPDRLTAELDGAGVEWARITAVGRIEVSAGFPGELFGPAEVLG